MAGDGRFRWFWSMGQNPETYQGPCDTKEEAVAAALAEDGETEGYTVVEADKAMISIEVFDADDIFTRFEEHNEECWGEDGAEIECTREQEIDLEHMMAATLAAWFEKHKTMPTAWCFGDQRNEEYMPPSKVIERVVR